MKFNINTIMVTILTLALMSSCKKWTDIEPPMQVDREEVFSTEQGFHEALNGVYLQMGGRSLYGRDLSMGLVSVLGRTYDTTITPAIGKLYYEGAKYNFQEPEVKASFKNIWDSIYYSIGNLNHLLEQVEERKAIFTGSNYQQVKGEALGLRAYLHFELLRMFVASPAAAGLDIPAIPYVTRLTPIATPVIKSGAVIDACISDLTNAEQLLSGVVYSSSRFNSWAAKAMMARVYQYKGDHANAKTIALEIIASGKFQLTTGGTDYMYTKEHIFSLFSSFTRAISFNKSVLNANPPLGFTTLNQTELFVKGSGATTDSRKQFVDPATGLPSGNMISPRKYYSGVSSSVNVLPLIKVSEMFLIASEASNQLQDSIAARGMLDSLRVRRNLVKFSSAIKRDSLNVEIAKEYQKEFLAEGQVFFFFKRKNLPIGALPFTKVQVVSNASYVFIRPE